MDNFRKNVNNSKQHQQQRDVACVGEGGRGGGVVMIKQCSVKHWQENIEKLLITTIIIILRLITKKETCFKTLPYFVESRILVQSHDISEASP